MKKVIFAMAVALLASACGTTGAGAVIDPSSNATPICQTKPGLPGCYSGGS